MCDTMVALGNSTVSGSVLFAKNSDRQPNEAHHLQLIPAASHPAGSTVQCTYRSIPQVDHTNAVLLAKPFWIWGAEMGANEFGVVIGNEAVFTKIPPGKEPGLIGMDFLRLALERAATAFDALQVITQLLEQYGQSGNCGFTHPFYYHNSYLIADRTEAWVLETADRQWAAEKVRDVRSISNGITIHNQWDLASSGLVDYAIERGWCKSRASFSFRDCYSDFIYTRFSDCRKRQACSTGMLQQARGKITPRTMMDILSSHAVEKKTGWSPDRGLFGADICMHAGFGPARPDQTTGSMVSELTRHGQMDVPDTHWLTGTAAPCTSIFKPVWLDAGLPDTGPVPSGTYGQDTLFWQHECLHRAVLRNYPQGHSLIDQERRPLQDRFIQQATAVLHLPPSERLVASQGIFEAASESEKAWLDRVRALPENMTFYGRTAWQAINREAKFPTEGI